MSRQIHVHVHCVSRAVKCAHTVHVDSHYVLLQYTNSCRALMSNTNSTACVPVQNTLADVSDTELADDTVAPDTGPTETTVVDMTKYKPYFRQVVL